MPHTLSQITKLAGVLLLGTLACANVQAQRISEENELLITKLERENRQLKRQLEDLRKNYQKALEREETKTKNLAEIKKNLALFGKDFFTNGDERLRDAVSDYQIASEKLTAVETSTTNLVGSINHYLRTALAADPESRADVELRLRELEAALGYRQKPKRKIVRGTPQESHIVSIDTQTGVAVINAGEDSKIRTGMKFRIERTGQHLGDAIVAVTRQNVSGLFLSNLQNNNNPIRPGDIARVITQSKQP